LKASRAANGVSELHGQVSRQMWQVLYPGKTEDQVPIGHITNGIHLMGWMKGPVRRFWKRKLGPDWEAPVNEPEFWQRVADPDFICASAVALARPAFGAWRFHRIRSTAQSGRADHWVCAALCHLQTRAADL